MTPILSRAAWTRPYAWPFLMLFAFNVLLFLAFTLPRSFKERATAREALALRLELADRRAEMAEVRTRAQTVKANIAETARFYREAVPDCTGQTAVILQELTAITRELGVVSGRLGSTPKEMDAVPLTEIGLTLPIQGTYQQVGAFLQKLERSRLFLIVESVALRERTGHGGGAELNVKLNAYCHSGGDPARRRRGR